MRKPPASIPPLKPLVTSEVHGDMDDDAKNEAAKEHFLDMFAGAILESCRNFARRDKDEDGNSLLDIIDGRTPMSVESLRTSLDGLRCRVLVIAERERSEPEHGFQRAIARDRNAPNFFEITDMGNVTVSIQPGFPRRWLPLLEWYDRYRVGMWPAGQKSQPEWLRPSDLGIIGMDRYWHTSAGSGVLAEDVQRIVDHLSEIRVGGYAAAR